MRLEPWAATAVLLALAACGSNDGGKDDRKGGNEAASAAPPAAPAAGGGSGGKDGSASLRLNPGAWDMVVESGEIAAPGMPAEVARMMKGMKITSRQCITPEEANRPKSDIFTGKQEGNCTYKEFSLSAGKLHAAIVCEGEGDGRTTVNTDGQFGGDSFDVRSRIETHGGGAPVTVESHVVGVRVGECTGKEQG